MKSFAFKKSSSLLALAALAPGLFWATQALAVEMEVHLPGMPTNVYDPGIYIKNLFIFGLSVIGFLAVGWVIIGGIQYMLAGSVSTTEKARKTILNALGGILLLLCSYFLLATIDPTLTNLSPLELRKINALNQYAIENFDIDPSLLAGKTAAEKNNILSSATINGQSTGVCAISSCGSKTVDGKTVSAGAASGYLALQKAVANQCAASGLSCTLLATSGVDGDHESNCHKTGTANSGTCLDFVVSAKECGGSIKGCSDEKKQQYIQAALGAIGGSGAGNVKSCLNEYQIQTAKSTGGHFHCNF